MTSSSLEQRYSQQRSSSDWIPSPPMPSTPLAQWHHHLCLTANRFYFPEKQSCETQRKKAEETHPAPSLLEDIVGSISTSTVAVVNTTQPVPRLMAIRKFTNTPALFEVCQGPLTETVDCIFPEHMPSCHGRETAPRTSKLQRVHSKWNTELSPFLQSPGEDPGMLCSGSSTNTKKRVTAHYLKPGECRNTLVHWL